MSSEAPAPAVTEPVPEVVTSTDASPAIDESAAQPVPEASEAAPVPADAPSTDPPAADAPADTDSSPVEESKPAEAKPDDQDKKEKKQTRKPFSDLLNKILKPHPHDKSTAEKKVDSETPAPETEEAGSATQAPAPDAAADPSPNAPCDPPAETTDEAPKDPTTPRKERGNIFDKITAFVMKPKSPKMKKAEGLKDDTDDAKNEASQAEPAPENQAVEASASAPEPTAVDGSATVESPEETKTDKKEKSPKDLAKLARRFSGRLFGAVERKKEVVKKAEPTPEEAEEAAQAEATPAAAAPTDAAPQIPAETLAEPSQSADSAPVIAAAA